MPAISELVIGEADTKTRVAALMRGIGENGAGQRVELAQVRR